MSRTSPKMIWLRVNLSMNPSAYRFHKAPAIYKITNTMNGKFYIGQAVNFYARMWLHFVKPPNPKLKNAVHKYGWDKFNAEILETPAICDLDAREQFYLDTLRPYDSAIGYNFLVTASSRKGVPHSQSTKDKISSALTGRTFSESSKRKMSGAKQGVMKGSDNPMYGKSHSTAACQKISAFRANKPELTLPASLANRKPVAQINLTDSSVIKIWPSSADVFRALGIQPAVISRVSKGRGASAGGYGWRFA